MQLSQKDMKTWHSIANLEAEMLNNISIFGFTSILLRGGFIVLKVLQDWEREIDGLALF